MLSRIFWVGIAGLALVTGMVLQDGDRMFSWGDHRDSVKTERSIEARIDRAIDRSFDHMQVRDADGKELDVPAETKRAMADAVGQLIKAETDLAMVKIGDESAEELQAATARRDQARAEVDRIKSEIEGQDEAAVVEQRVRDQVRDEIRESVREAVRN